MSSDPSFFEFAIVIAGLIVSIMLIVAVLKIPKIARYQKATMKLTALMAKKAGVNNDLIQNIVNETDKEVDYNFSKELSS
jgi:hypothetical protein